MAAIEPRGGKERGRGTPRAGGAALALGLAVIGLTGVPEATLAQSTPQHAAPGRFLPPTPADRFRQDPDRNNLVHAEGYQPAPLGRLGSVVTVPGGPTPVVLVAGLGFGARVFETLTDQLGTADYTFHLVTLPGYGGSSAPPMPDDPTSFADAPWLTNARDALSAWIAAERLDRPLVGALYSDAANVVVRLAAERPDQVGGVILLSSSPRFPLGNPSLSRGPAIEQFARQWFRTVTEIMWPSGMFTPDYYASDPTVGELAWWEVLEPTLPTAIRYQVETWATDLVPVASGLGVPTVALSPAFDFLDEEGMRRNRTRFHDGWNEAAEANPRLEHRVVAGGRFLLWLDAPEAVEAAVRELAAERSGG